MDALLVTPISKAAATQRAGRAGRVKEGKCYRIYSKDAYDRMEEDTVPEIQRSSLLAVTLSLKRMGIRDITSFPLIDPPSPALLRTSLRQLIFLEALKDEHGELTPIGSFMSHFPLTPFLSRALYTARFDPSTPCLQEMLSLVAMLSVESIWKPTKSPREGREEEEEEMLKVEERKARFTDPSGDHATLVNVLESWRNWGKEEEEEKEGNGGGYGYGRRKGRHRGDRDWASRHGLRRKPLSTAERIRRQLEGLMDRYMEGGYPRRKEKEGEGMETREKSRTYAHIKDSKALLRALCTGFFIHTAKRHGRHPVYYHYLASTGSHLDQGRGGGGGGGEDQVGIGGGGMLGLHLSPECVLWALEEEKDGGTDRRRHHHHHHHHRHGKGAEWVVYHEVMHTGAKAVMRIISHIHRPWVEDGIRRVQDMALKAYDNAGKEKVASLSSSPSHPPSKKKEEGVNDSPTLHSAAATPSKVERSEEVNNRDDEDDDDGKGEEERKRQMRQDAIAAAKARFKRRRRLE